jgi:outer membrane protein OmpA-like peptidoglycan-associated protein
MKGERCHRQLESVAEEQGKDMDDSKPAPPRNASRTLVIAAVAVLIVVAIAGIVLAGLRGRSAGSVPGSLSSATQQSGSAPTASAPVIAAEVGAGPNQIAFASASDTLSPISLKKILDVAQTAKKGGHTVAIAAKLSAGSDRAERMELAKKRADAVRRALQAGGMSVGALTVQISQDSAGLVTPIEADRIDLSMK